MGKKGQKATHQGCHAEGWVWLISNVLCCPFPIPTFSIFNPSSLQGLFFVFIINLQDMSQLSFQVLVSLNREDLAELQPLVTEHPHSPSSLSLCDYGAGKENSIIAEDMKSWMSSHFLYTKCFLLLLHLRVNFAASGPDLFLGWHSVPDEH